MSKRMRYGPRFHGGTAESVSHPRDLTRASGRTVIRRERPREQIDAERARYGWSPIDWEAIDQRKRAKWGMRQSNTKRAKNMKITLAPLPPERSR